MKLKYFNLNILQIPLYKFFQGILLRIIFNRKINVIYLKFRILLFEFFLYISKLPLNLEGKVRSR